MPVLLGCCVCSHGYQHDFVWPQRLTCALPGVVPCLPAVITGVQIHNWGVNFEDNAPNMEFVAPTAAYVVVNGQKTNLDLSSLPVRLPGSGKSYMDITVCKTFA